MFRDTDWFAKVFVGAMTLALAWTGIGGILLCGYLVLTVRGLTEGNEILPEWGTWKPLLREGIVFLSSAAIILSPLIGAAALANHWWVRCTITIVAALLLPSIVLHCARRAPFVSFYSRDVLRLAARNLRPAAAAIGVFAGACSLGWISLVIGWPIVIFWSLLASTSLIARMH